MAPTRYSLHYEDYSEHMLSRFGKLLQMQSLVDMTLMCNSHTLRVHKAVLAACSVYFQEVLQKQSGEPLIILKMRFSVLKCLVEFMYCGKTQCAEENLDELVAAAQFLKIKGLAKVTKEDLGLTSTTEVPVFTPPVVINRPPQSMFNPAPQQQDVDGISSAMAPPQAPVTTSSAPVTVTNLGPIGPIGRPAKDKDTIVRIPFDIETGNSAGLSSSYSEGPRPVKQRKPRANNTRTMARVSGAWESGTALSRAAGRALLRREQDSRKAIHQLKHLQSRHMQDYMPMEHMSLSHAVSSICGSDPPPPHYMNMDTDLMYVDQASSSVLDPSLPSYSKENPIGTITNETITSNYSTATSAPSNPGINTAMSQYVNALKNAGLPTDLPILFESGDGSYINVNEQVLLDMVQSSEIQYEVIEQPNIIEKVADPSEIKSIDDLSKSIERGEMTMEGYTARNYDSSDHYTHDTINGLNSILPDNLEAFSEQQNFVVLDPPLQEANNMDPSNANDFSCIDGDMQFFTKSMSDDVKKYYQEPNLHDSREMDQLCPTSTMDANFSMSLLDTKSSLGGNMSQQYNPLSTEDMRRNEDCYDFGLPLKEDALDCLMAATPKRPDDDDSHDHVKRAQERDMIIQDLMSIEKTISEKNQNQEEHAEHFAANIQDFDVYNDHDQASQNKDKHETFTSNELNDWNTMNMGGEKDDNEVGVKELTAEYNDSVIDLTDNNRSIQLDRETIQLDNADYNKENESPGVMGDLIQNDIPFALGLLPMKQGQPNDDDGDSGLQKRKHDIDDLLDSDDAKCLKRKVKKRLHIL